MVSVIMSITDNMLCLDSKPGDKMTLFLHPSSVFRRSSTVSCFVVIFVAEPLVLLMNVCSVIICTFRVFSGVLYFFSCTVNPILYNLLSRKFRRAFKRTLCRCCVNINSLPTFYMLKAKFINNNERRAHAHHVPSAGGNSSQQQPDANAMRLVTFYKNEKYYGNSKRNISTVEKPSTRETMINRTSRSSTCSSHAHSDGGLHSLCRHKRCASRRQSSLTPRQCGHVASYQDIDMLRRKDGRAASPHRQEGTDIEEPVVLYDQTMPVSESPVLRITLRV